jgi:hypothetical protein
VTPRSVVDPAAVPIAATHLYLTTPKLMLDVAHDVVRAWRELRCMARGVSFELFAR